MRSIIVAVFFLILTVIIGVSAYLSPNDLKGCDSKPAQQGRCQKADAIVAISGGNTSLRTNEAIRLYNLGWARYIIFSGAAADSSSPSNAAVMRLQALKAGVPSSAIITEEFGRTTRQNAANTNKTAKDYAISRVIVVTSPYHQRRAGIEFRTHLQNVAVLDYPVSNDPDWPWYWWLTPRGWWLAGGEIIKIGAVQAGESQ